MSEILIIGHSPQSANVRYGVIYDEDIETYHANPAVSKSKLDVLINTTPELYHATYIAKSIPRDEDKEWAVLGNAAGAMILEGIEVYDKRYMINPEDAPKRPTDRQRTAKKQSPETIEAVAYWDNFDTVNKGRTLISKRQDTQVRGMFAQVQNHELARALLSRGAPEVTMRTRARNFDIQCRFDWVCLGEHGGASAELVHLLRRQGLEIEIGQPYAVDLKTTMNMSDFTEKRFDRSFSDYGYHRQGPFYRSVCAEVTGACIDHFFFLAVEKKEPFAAEVFLPSEEANESGWGEVRQGLRLLNGCIESGVWEGLRGGFSRIGLTNFYKNPLELKGRA